MEFFFVASNAIRLQHLGEVLSERKPFLTLEFETFWNYSIYFFKCIIAAYGVKKFVPVYLTLVSFALNSLCFAEHELFDNLWTAVKVNSLPLLHYTFRPDTFPLVLNAAIWCISCGNPDFEFFLDIYVMVTVLFCVKDTYAEEYEKGCVALFYLYSVNYICDCYIGKDQITFWHGAMTIYLPCIMLLLLRPVSNRAKYAFFQLAVLTAVYLTIKLMNAMESNGVKENILYDGTMDLYHGVVGLMYEWMMDIKSYVLMAANATSEEALTIFRILTVNV